MVRTTAEENKVLARRFGEAMKARQFEVLNELVAPDFVRHCQATPEVDGANSKFAEMWVAWDDRAALSRLGNMPAFPGTNA